MKEREYQGNDTFKARLKCLANLSRSDDECKPIAKSLLKFYRTHGYLTDKQRVLVNQLSEKKKAKFSTRKARFFVYAITDEKRVKIGISKDVKKRLTQLQTSTPRKLRVVDFIDVGANKNNAWGKERRAHMFFSKFRISGEWFDVSPDLFWGGLLDRVLSRDVSTLDDHLSGTLRGKQ